MQQLILQYFPVFLLVFVRMTAFFVTVPVLSARGVPNQAKVGLSFLVAFMSFAYVPQTAPIPLDLSFALYAIKEALVGIVLGLILQMIFYAVQVAGGLIDMQNGFALANVIDPRTGAYVPITGNFKNIFATLYFLSIDGHHILIRGIITSYQAVPIDMGWVSLGSEALFMLVVKCFSYMFMSAFLIAAPIAVALFLVDLSLGIIAKSVPQFNIFVVGLPIKIFASFLILVIVMPGFFVVLSELFERMFMAMSEMMTILGGQR
ncbi:flagellar type III secretion system protein FliR [Brevibacillus humidisoli]|uniref:flagellar biosynthetic protein FliR n=1 Tax=Brevibacillus humidisoli TaxID=2895522 RepID=UPI001E30366C|nr:flagellar biosynthetic protein FliR [Brevibacillus humidisoli]UFJ42140.1 flagellar type III secretion system protein FliR [Brevibacillus humidisoli]